MVVTKKSFVAFTVTLTMVFSASHSSEAKVDRETSSQILHFVVDIERGTLGTEEAAAILEKLDVEGRLELVKVLEDRMSQRSRELDQAEVGGKGAISVSIASGFLVALGTARGVVACFTRGRNLMRDAAVVVVAFIAGIATLKGGMNMVVVKGSEIKAVRAELERTRGYLAKLRSNLEQQLRLQ